MVVSKTNVQFKKKLLIIFKYKNIKKLLLRI